MIPDASKELSSGWADAAVQDVIPFSYGKGLTKRDRDASGLIPVYGSSGRVGVHKSALVEHATIIVGRKGSVGDVYVCRAPSYPIDTVFFSQATDDLSLDFVAYQLRFLQLARLDKSTTIPSLSRDHLHTVRLRLAPRLEQTRIVDAIEEQFTRLDSGVAALKRVEANLKRYKASVLKAACEGKLTETWRQRNPLSKRPALGSGVSPLAKENRPTWLPETWEWTALQDVAEYKGGHAFKSKHFVDSGTCQVLRIGNVPEGAIDLRVAPVFITDDDGDASTSFELAKDDLLITMTRTRYKQDYGHVGLVSESESDRRLFVNQRVGRLRCNAACHPRYLYLWLQCDVYRKIFFSGKTGNVNQRNVGAKPLKLGPVALPCFDEQLEIIEETARIMSLIESIERVLERSESQTRSLRQSILKRAFEGKLVEQDASDEPASVLLDRIRASRDSSGSGKSQNVRPGRKRRKNSRKSA